MGSFQLAGFLASESYSYAPKMLYNDSDSVTDTSPGVGSINIATGKNGQTRISDDSAYSFTIGGRVTVAFHSAQPVEQPIK